jgi:hypothetical protein
MRNDSLLWAVNAFHRTFGTDDIQTVKFASSFDKYKLHFASSAA